MPEQNLTKAGTGGADGGQQGSKQWAARSSGLPETDASRTYLKDGHAISGLSALQLGSLIAVIGFFLGGLAVTYLVVPLIF